MRSEECRARLSAALKAGRLTELELSDLAEIELYAEYRRRFGDGESAALAVGVHRHWTIAIDEKGPSRHEVLEKLGDEFLLTTPVILGIAVSDGLLVPGQVAGIRTLLASNRYVLAPVAGEDS